MNPRQHIQEELRSLESTLPYEAHTPVFSVPNNYFENFAASVLQRLKAEAHPSAAEELASLSPLLAGLSKQPPYSVPENYFTELEQELPLLTNDTPLPPFLANLSRTMPNGLPEGYFESLPAVITARVVPAATTRVVPLFRRSWMRMAAAAVVAGAFVVGGIAYFSGRSTLDPAQQPQAWVASQLKGVSNQDLERFIETAGAASSTTEGTAPTTEVKGLLHDVSVSEMDAFLAQVPAEEDELSNIN